MSVLSLRDVTIRVAGRTLLDRANLMVEPGRRIGLVGRNGAGKSTLLRAIAGELAVDGGDIRLAARARLGWVRQEAPGGPGSLVETVLAADEERTALLAEVDDPSSDPGRLADAHERLVAIDADSAPARAATILAGLGFDAAAQARPVESFSGGWRMRVALAAVLFAAPDLLLLDEPTNHLDLEATIWLEGWLARYPGAALIVSHDRGLLDRAVEAIAHLDHGQLTLTPGGFDAFVRIRTERAMQQTRVAAKVAERRAHLQAFVDRFRAKATKARQAQARLKAIARLPMIESVVEDTVTRFSFPQPAAMAPPIVTLDQVSVGYGGIPVLRGLSLRLDMEDRLALLGPNGNGKSTLAKLIAGRLEALSGRVFRGAKLRVGFFAQHQEEELEAGESATAHMVRALPGATPPQVRSQLARFGLGAERAETAVGHLSGGEKARLLMALATRDAPHLLILDEPTNHLDIDARDALVRALGEFAGAVVLITHDPNLVELVADRLLLVAAGTATPFEGDVNEYRAVISERGRSGSSSSGVDGAKRGGERRERARTREINAPLRRRAREAENVLGKLGTERARLEHLLADPHLYAAERAADMPRLQARLAEVAREIEQAETVWLAAEEALAAE